MVAIVGVHGVNQHLKGSATLHAEWSPALVDGVRLAYADIGADSLTCAFYGQLFRPEGRVRAAGDPAYRSSDLTPDEAELLLLWWQNAADLEPERVVAPDARTRASAPRSIQAGLRALARSSFFAGMAERALIGALKQVRRYLREPEIRDAAQVAVDAVVTPETRVIVGHSLGSVVAYEALHRFGQTDRWANVDTLVTLGSPLGIPNLIFDELQPAPNGGRGRYPPVERWTNVSDEGDVVALVKELSPLFDGALVDVAIDNGSKAHDIGPYLTARETGAAIAEGIADG